MPMMLSRLAAQSDGVLALHMPALSAGPRSRGGQNATPAAPQGIAVIPIQGVLTPHGNYDWFGFTAGMDSIRAALTAAANSADVGAIVALVDSPGGTVAMTEETADALAAASAVKPTVAYVESLAASAAYWIASQAREVVMTPSADVGSIGVYALHQSYARALTDAGIDTTFVRSTAFKGEGNSLEPLSNEARANLQARVDEADAKFVEAVARGRKTNAGRVRAEFGQGRTMGAQAAVAAGMADRVGSFESVIQGLAAQIAGPRAPLRRRAAIV